MFGTGATAGLTGLVFLLQLARPGHGALAEMFFDKEKENVPRTMVSDL